MSRRKKGPGVIRTLVRIVLLALLFGFVPWFFYQAAFGKTKTRTLSEAYGKDKPFGAEEADKPAPPPPPSADPQKDAASAEPPAPPTADAAGTAQEQ